MPLPPPPGASSNEPSEALRKARADCAELLATNQGNEQDRFAAARALILSHLWEYQTAAGRPLSDVSPPLPPKRGFHGPA